MAEIVATANDQMCDCDLSAGGPPPVWDLNRLNLLERICHSQHFASKLLAAIVHSFQEVEHMLQAQCQLALRDAKVFGFI